MRAPLVALALAMTLLPVAAWPQVPRQPEFLVNAYSSSTQSYPGVAADAAGNFVVTWTSDGQDGDQHGIFARRHDVTGAPIGSAEFRVNTYTTGRQTSSVASAAADGALAFAWIDWGQEGNFGVRARKFDASGTPVGNDLRANSYTTGAQSFHFVGMDDSGRFVVGWQSQAQDGSGFGIFAQRYDASGASQGPEFRVNAVTTGDQREPTMAMAADGSFVVVWLSSDGSGNGVFARRFDTSGTASGADFRINEVTTGSQYDPAVAVDAAGNFVVVWNLDGGAGDVIGRRFTAAGVPLTGDFRVNAYTTGLQIRPSIASDAAGDFVVVWQGAGAGDDVGVFARRYDDGVAGGEFRVNSVTTANQARPAVASDPDGRFVVAWALDTGAVGTTGFGIWARQFLPERIFGDDFESGNLAAWSASNTDGDDLVVSSAAAQNFTSAGLLGLVDDTAALFVEDHTPDDELRYRVRFHFDPNGFDPGEAENHRRTRVFIAFTEAPTRRVAAIVLRRLGGVYAIMGRARLDDNAQADTGFFPIGDGPHVVEFDLQPASGPDAEDGSFELRIDGVPQTVLTGLDNSLARVDLARLGALSVKSGAAGTLYWDEFESWRTAFAP
jgi:hypothetical protein